MNTYPREISYRELRIHLQEWQCSAVNKGKKSWNYLNVLKGDLLINYGIVVEWTLDNS